MQSLTHYLQRLALALPLASVASWSLWTARAQDTAPPSTSTAPPVEMGEMAEAASALPMSPGRDEFLAISLAMREGRFADAKRLLIEKEAGSKDWSQSLRSRWNTLAARAAVRLGDRAWLREVNTGGALSESGDDLMVLAAMRFLMADRLDDAKRVLKSLPPPAQLSETARRRSLQLSSRIAQLEGRPEDERATVSQLVDFVSKWPQPQCQSCHANPRAFPNQVTTMDVRNWWMGERFVELVRATGDAKPLERRAREILAKAPGDEDARIKLAYALRAQGDEAASDAEMRRIPWAEFPEREKKRPLRFGQFP